jgi:hypothetical protein
MFSFLLRIVLFYFRVQSLTKVTIGRVHMIARDPNQATRDPRQARVINRITGRDPNLERVERYANAS